MGKPGTPTITDDTQQHTSGSKTANRSRHPRPLLRRLSLSLLCLGLTLITLAVPSSPTAGRIARADAAPARGKISVICRACHQPVPTVELSATFSGIYVEGMNFPPNAVLSVELFNADLPFNADVILTGSNPFEVQAIGPCGAGGCGFNVPGTFDQDVYQAFDPCPDDYLAALGAMTIRAVVTEEDLPLGSPIPTYTASTTTSCTFTGPH